MNEGIDIENIKKELNELANLYQIIEYEAVKQPERMARIEELRKLLSQAHTEKVTPKPK